MRVLITGATGNIGVSLIDRLATEDAVTEIVGVARRRPDWSPSKTTWVEADVAVDDLTPTFAGVDAVVHLAWAFQPTHNPQLTWKNNVLGSMRVFEAAVAAGVSTLVHASSVGAYSPRTSTDRVDESWPTHALPTAGYGREKSYLERVLDTVEAANPELRVVRMRPGFIFERRAASEQRRLFGGPLLPGSLVRKELIPVIPALPGLQVQALHARDAAEAFRLALVTGVRGAFNIAAEPVLDVDALAELLGARPVPMPAWAPRALIAAAWRLHLLPASPALFDLVLSLPVMDTSRAREELGWLPRVTSFDAVAEVMAGMRDGSGGPTPPLAADAGGSLRQHEVATGVGAVGGVTEDGR